METFLTVRHCNCQILNDETTLIYSLSIRPFQDVYRERAADVHQYLLRRSRAYGSLGKAKSGSNPDHAAFATVLFPD